jgi:hypothetical protein
MFVSDQGLSDTLFQLHSGSHPRQAQDDCYGLRSVEGQVEQLSSILLFYCSYVRLVRVLLVPVPSSYPAAT